MTDIVLRDIEVVLADRIGRVGQAYGLSTTEALLHLLERGLSVCEGEGALRFAEHEARVLQGAIAALEQVPNDPGFAMIGRAEPAAQPVDEPDQSIAARFAPE